VVGIKTVIKPIIPEEKPMDTVIKHKIPPISGTA